MLAERSSREARSLASRRVGPHYGRVPVSPGEAGASPPCGGTAGSGAPILKIRVPQTGQRPSVAGRPFFIVICFGSRISRGALHLTQ